ncbi:MAG: family transcriptional regulator [Capsulimonas sp.]|jgi:predicted NBD/HSP70 family sugar kinase|nr:family transcriptional regulator [Capsulimonas sp.]
MKSTDVQAGSISRADAARKPSPVRKKLAGTNLEFAHVLNQRVVLETVRLWGPLSRAEISSHTYLTNQTISNIVDKLLDRGLLETLGRRSGQRGQPAIEVNINPKGGYAVGIHLDRDHLTAVLLDLAGTPLEYAHLEWSFPSPDEALPLIEKMIRGLVEDQGLRMEELWGVGVGLPGPLDIGAGTLVAPPNFPGWDELPIRDILSKRLDLPVFLETDAMAAAMGERWFGAGKDVEDYFYVFFGVGIGGGMILNGQPYRGAFDNAGMFGHLPVGASGNMRCSCGGIGCLELSVSLSSLFAALSMARPEARVNDLDMLLGENDAILIGWLENAAESLAAGLVTIEHLLSPKAIIFGGRLPVPLQKWLIERLEMMLPQRRMRALRHHPVLLQASAIESAAALGAATLPLFNEFAPG